MANRYWRGGSGTWGTATTNWSATDGGAGGASVPTAADDVFVTSLSGSPTITVSGARVCKSLTTTGATCTIASTGTLTISGGMTLSSTTTWTNTGALAFLVSGTITTNGVLIQSPITLNGTGQTFTLGGNLTTNKAFTLSAGNLTLSNNTLQTLSFASNVTVARVLAFGTGNITVTGSGTVFNVNSTSLTYTGTPTVNISNSGSTATTVTQSGSSATNAFNFNFTTGTYTLSLGSGSGRYGNLDFTGFSGTVANTTITLYKNLVASSSTTFTPGSNIWTFAPPAATETTITTNGRTLDFPITLNGDGTLKLLDSFSQGSSRAFLRTAGTLDINSQTNTFGTLSISSYPTYIINGVFNASNITQTIFSTVTVPSTQILTTSGTYTFSTSGTLDVGTNGVDFSVGSVSLSAGTVAFGSSGQLTLTGNNTTVYSATTPTFTGTIKIVSNYSGSTGTRTFAMGSMAEADVIDVSAEPVTGLSFGTAGSDTILISGNLKSLNLTGFTGTFNGGVNSKNLFGDFTIPPSGISFISATSSTQDVFFSATSGTQTLTTNGNQLPFPITKGGIGGTLLLDDDLTLTGTYGELTLSSGTLNANDVNVSVTSFVGSGSNPRTLNMGAGTWTLSGTGTVWNLVTTTSLTFNKDTANIVLSDTSTTARTFAGGGLTYNNLEIGGSTGISTLTFTGANTFNTISSTKTVSHTIVLPASTTTTCNNWTINGSSGNLISVQSSTSGTQATLALSSGTKTVSYAGIKDITASPANTWTASDSLIINSVDWLIGSGTQYGVVLTSGTTWTVPDNWNSDDNTIYLFGAGGGGRTGANSTLGGAGGGGGGFVQINNFAATPGGTVSYTIGVGGTGVITGGDGTATTFSSGAYSAGGGFGATNGGAGGTGTGGDVNYTGGSGGTTTAVSTKGGSGGGGAAGPLGNGGNGATGAQGTLAPSGGGGGNGGGSAGGLPDGGDNASGTGGGSGAGASGVNGGGGSGTDTANILGGNGGNGVEIFGLYGGGGGAGGNGNASNSPTAGLFGGGGSGGGFQVIGARGGAGAAGGIVMIYAPIISGSSSNFFLLF